jgi:hypothetical protein
MEIQRPAIDERSRIDLTRKNREAIAASAPAPAELAERSETREAGARDRVDVSSSAREIAGREDDARAEARRRERLDELRAARERGELNTDARVERAAVRMLEGS